MSYSQTAAKTTDQQLVRRDQLGNRTLVSSEQQHNEAKKYDNVFERFSPLSDKCALAEQQPDSATTRPDSDPQRGCGMNRTDSVRSDLSLIENMAGLGLDRSSSLDETISSDRSSQSQVSVLLF